DRRALIPARLLTSRRRASASVGRTRHLCAYLDVSVAPNLRVDALRDCSRNHLDAELSSSFNFAIAQLKLNG
ncbi:MAG: hypothetical protein ACM36C_03215, partial [Acidobacteriota bacterium]